MKGLWPSWWVQYMISSKLLSMVVFRRCRSKNIVRILKFNSGLWVMQVSPNLTYFCCGQIYPIRDRFVQNTGWVMQLKCRSSLVWVRFCHLYLLVRLCRFIIVTQESKGVMSFPALGDMSMMEMARAIVDGGKKLRNMSSKWRILGMNFLIVKERMIWGWKMAYSIWLELPLGGE